MRHRIKNGKVGSFTPEKLKVEMVELEDREVAEEVEDIFEEDSAYSNDDEASSKSSSYILSPFNSHYSISSGLS